MFLRHTSLPLFFHKHLHGCQKRGSANIAPMALVLDSIVQSHWLDMPSCLDYVLLLFFQKSFSVLSAASHNPCLSLHHPVSASILHFSSPPNSLHMSLSSLTTLRPSLKTCQIALQHIAQETPPSQAPLIQIPPQRVKTQVVNAPVLIA